MFDHGRLAGAVTAAEVATRMAMSAPHGNVGAAMQRDVPAFESSTPLGTALEALDRAGIAFVIDRGELVGMLTPDQLAAFAALHQRV